MDLNNRWFNGQPIHAELSPVTDFREACCRQYEMGWVDGWAIWPEKVSTFWANHSVVIKYPPVSIGQLARCCPLTDQPWQRKQINTVVFLTMWLDWRHIAFPRTTDGLKQSSLDAAVQTETCSSYALIVFITSADERISNEKNLFATPMLQTATNLSIWAFIFTYWCICTTQGWLLAVLVQLLRAMDKKLHFRHTCGQNC